MNEITLTILGDTSSFKVMVYKNNRIYKEYVYPELHNIPVYAGQKIEFIYKERRSWTYDDKNYKTHYFEHGTTHAITVPSSAEGPATLHVSDRYSEWFLELNGALGWIHKALIPDKAPKANKDFEDEYSEHEPGCCR